MDSEIDKTLDCRDLSCKVTIENLNKVIIDLKYGDVLEVFSTVECLKSSITKWSIETKNSIIREEKLERGISRYIILIKK